MIVSCNIRVKTTDSGARQPEIVECDAVKSDATPAGVVIASPDETPRTLEVAGKSYTLASFKVRIIASLIESGCAVLRIFVGSGLTLAFGYTTNPHIGFLICGHVLTWVYVVCMPTYNCIRYNGQTMGKKIMGIRYLKLDGKPFTGGDYVRMMLGYWLAVPFGNIGLVLTLFHPNRQGFHNLASGCVVVNA